MKRVRGYKKSIISLSVMAIVVTSVYATPTEEANAIVSTYTHMPTFQGIEDSILLRGESFDPLEGISAWDELDGDITHLIEIDGEFDVHTEGTYTLVYTVKNSVEKETQVQRKIDVNLDFIEDGDGPTLIGIEDSLVIQRNTKPNLIEGVEAYDKEGVDVSKTIRIQGDFDYTQEGIYPLIYEAHDSLMRVSRVERLLIVEEAEKPEENIDLSNIKNALERTNEIPLENREEKINVEYADGESKIPTLLGLDDTDVEINGFFAPMLGVKAYDYRGNDITKQVSVSGVYDLSQEGTLIFTYAVTDEEGNQAKIYRNVNIVPNEL